MFKIPFFLKAVMLFPSTENSECELKHLIFDF